MAIYIKGLMDAAWSILQVSSREKTQTTEVSLFSCYLARPRPRVKLPRDDIPPLPRPPGPPFTFGGGDLGRRASIRSVQPVVIWPLAKYPA